MIFCFWRDCPMVGQGLLKHEVSRSHTTHHPRWYSSGRVISSSQRPLPNTQHSQQTNIHDPGWIRTHNLSRPAATDLRLRPSGHWERLTYIILHHKNMKTPEWTQETITTWKSELLHGIHIYDLETPDVDKTEPNAWLAYSSQKQMDL
jgi:hypothetical protein